MVDGNNIKKGLTEWNDQMKAIKDGLTIEATEDVYWSMLESVPPAYQDRNGFVTSEPYSHNDDGIAMYFCFVENFGIESITIAFLGTIAEYKKFTS